MDNPGAFGERYKLHDWQLAAVQRIVDVLLSGQCRMFSAPTGTGKSVVELSALHRLLEMGKHAILLTPLPSIIGGMLAKLGYPVDTLSDADFWRLADMERLATPLRYRNRLMLGDTQPADYLIIDEAHHDSANTYQDVHALTGQSPRVGMTATPFRGNPKSNREFREFWGEPEPLITIPQAIAAGYWSMPTCVCLPLVDDDICTIANGEFTVASVTDVITPRIDAVADYCKRYVGAPHWARWDRPTMFSVPSGQLATLLTDALNSRGLTARKVTQDTPRSERADTFAATLSRDCALVQIKVVSEGVDLPIRRLIDVAPMLSPVAWLQQFGRITRPTTLDESAPEYVCTNRNLLRHAYLLGGMIPLATYKQAQDAFDAAFMSKLPSRNAIRAVGLEAIGRLKATEFVTASGMKCLLYCVSTMIDATRTEYACVLHPTVANPIWVAKQSPKVGDTTSWGKWYRCETPRELTGFASVPPKPITKNQKAYWDKCAKRAGLKVDVKLDARTFQILPICMDTGMRFE